LGLDYTVARKTRYADHTVELALTDLSLLAGRPVLVVDDIVSSGSTLITCAKAAIAAGATVVDAVCTHALFPSEQIVTFAGAGIRSIRSTNSIPHVTNAFVLDDLFVTALRREIESSLSKFPA
jgi:ribose-phosphate pyrophosphokinase